MKGLLAAQGAGLAKSRLEALGKGLSLRDAILYANANPATDFEIRLAGAAGNKLPVPVSARRAQDNATATTLGELSLSVFADADGALNGTQPLAANQAALVVATQPAIAGTYLLANDATAALSLINDTMINLTGHIGRLPTVGAFARSILFE